MRLYHGSTMHQMDVKKELIEGIMQDIIRFLCEEGNPLEKSLEIFYNSLTFAK